MLQECLRLAEQRRVEERVMRAIDPLVAAGQHADVPAVGDDS